MATLPLDQIVQGDCVEVLQSLPDDCVDLIFADPPYNLQLQQELRRPNNTIVDAVTDGWDQFDSFAAYDEFTCRWLGECRRVLKDDGAIWVIGSYHNIFRIGSLLMDLDYWILNDIIWHKLNPMPNFRGMRFTNATETLIWAKKAADQKYTFNYRAMKNLNDDKQMQNVWQIPICSGAERIKIDGRKAHSTQKPEALLYRVIMASTNPADVILDPFFGTGTTGAVAKKLHRHYIGIERDPLYVEVAQKRLAAIAPDAVDPRLLETPSRRKQQRVAFAVLLEAGYLKAGQMIFSQSRDYQAVIKADGQVVSGQCVGSIHAVGAQVQGKESQNGWDFWHFEDEDGQLVCIDALRDRYRQENQIEVE